jgi:hypothetical protein
VGFVLDGRPLFGRLCSDAVEPEWAHHKTFFLHSKRDRVDMFDFVLPARSETEADAGERP